MNWEMLTAVAGWVGKASGQAAILIVLVLTVQWVARERLAARWRYALWLLVAARLALPATPASPWSLFNWVQPQTLALRTTALAVTVPSANDGGIPELTKTVPPETTSKAELIAAQATTSEMSPKVTPPPAVNSSLTPPTQAAPQLDSTPPRIISPAAASMPATTAPKFAAPAILPQHTATPAPRSEPLSWLQILTLVWLAGTLALAARIAWECLRLARVIRQSKPVSDPVVLEALAACQREMGTALPGSVRATEHLGSPALCGLWRPQLLVPAAFVGQFTAAEWRHIFRHELAHQRRRDPLANWLLTLLQILHWFNPLVWVGFHQMRADRELACDALALANADSAEAKAYGRTLVKVMEHLAPAAPLPGLVGLLEDRRQAERRLRLIARHRPGARGTWAFALALAALSVLCLSDALPAATSEPMRPSLPIVDPDSNNESQIELLDPKDSTNRITFEIKIIDQMSQRPIIGAVARSWILDRAWYARRYTKAPDLSPRPEKQVESFTDRQGVCKIVAQVDLPFNPNAIFAISHSNYAPKQVSLTIPLQTKQLISRKGNLSLIDPITVELESGCAIGGIVQDEFGRPLSGTQIRIINSIAPGTNRQETTYQAIESSLAEALVFGGKESLKTTVTDASGRWRLEHIPSDVYRLVLEATTPDGARQWGNFREALSPEILLPSWMSDSFAEDSNLDDLLRQQAVITLRPGVSISGQVVDSQGKPIAGAILRTSNRPDWPQLIIDHFATTYQTDAKGRFLLARRLPGELILSASASAKGFASAAQSVMVGTNDINVVIRMSEPRPLRVRVLDFVEERPLANATMEAQTVNGRIFHWHGAADKNGLIVWTNAPAEVSDYIITAPAYRPLHAQLAPAEEAQTVMLGRAAYPKNLAWLRVQDAITGQPVAAFGVYEKTNLVIHGEHGRVHYNTWEITSLSIRADGYRKTYITGLQPGYDNDVLVQLLPGQPISGIVSTPDNQVAANVEIRLDIDSKSKDWYPLNPLMWAETETVFSDASGHFGIPNPPEDCPIVFIHPQGYWLTTADQLAKAPQVRLQAWGRLEGQLQPGLHLNPGQTLWLNHFRHTWPTRTGYHATLHTDNEGHFKLDRLIAGEYLLTKEASHYLLTPPDFYPQQVQIESGKTTRITYGGQGRTVKGKIQCTPAGTLADLGDFTAYLELKLELPPGVKHEPPSCVTPSITVPSTPAQIAYARKAKAYDLEVDEAGHLTAQLIPPGTYWLYIQLSKPNNLFANWVSLKTEVSIPEPTPGHEDDFVNLGTFTVPLKPAK